MSKDLGVNLNTRVSVKAMHAPDILWVLQTDRLRAWATSTWHATNH